MPVEIIIYETISGSVINDNRKLLGKFLTGKNVDSALDVTFTTNDKGQINYKVPSEYENSHSFFIPPLSKQAIESKLNTILTQQNIALRKVLDIGVDFFPLKYLKLVSVAPKYGTDKKSIIYWACYYKMEVGAYTDPKNKSIKKIEVANCNLQLDVNAAGNLIGLDYNLLPIKSRFKTPLYTMLAEDNTELELNYLLNAKMSRLAPFYNAGEPNGRLPASKESHIIKAKPDTQKASNEITVNGKIISFTIFINDQIYLPVVKSWDPLAFKTFQFIKYVNKDKIEQNPDSGVKLTAGKTVFSISIKTTKGDFYKYFYPELSKILTVFSDGVAGYIDHMSLKSVSNIEDVSKSSWGETLGLYPTGGNNLYTPDKWYYPASLEILKARAAITLVATRNDKVQSDSPDLNKSLEKLLAKFHSPDNFPEVEPEIQDNENVKYFYLSPNPNTRHTSLNDSQRIVRVYGPFYNVGGGDVKVGMTYIIFYEATD